MANRRRSKPRSKSPTTHEKKAIELVRLIELLQQDEWLASELRAETGVGERTLFDYLNEDLVKLQELLGFEYIRTGEPTLYRIKPNEQLKPAIAVVVHAALRMLTHHSPGDSKDYKEAQRILAKGLPEPAKGIALESARNLGEGRLPSFDGTNLPVIIGAWTSYTTIQFDYELVEQNKRLTYQANVYFVEVSRANMAVYIIAKDLIYTQAIRTFKLSRMHRVMLVGEPGSYCIEDSFNPADFLSTAWGILAGSDQTRVRVRLKFSPDAAKRILEGGFPKLELDKETLIGEATVGTDKRGFPLEILPWIQSWGPRVEVLEPKNLRVEWLNQARELLARYGGGDSTPSPNRFWAHSPNPKEGIPPHFLSDHLRQVSDQAMHNARDFSIPQIQPLLQAAGLLHDLGKYKLEFQRKRLGYDPITGRTGLATQKGVDHSSLGAVVVYPAKDQLSPEAKAGLLTISKIIAAHHAGLADTHAFESRIKEQQSDPFRKEALGYAAAELPDMQSINSLLAQSKLELKPKSLEFLTRMALSCLVDADHTDSEVHGKPQQSAVRSKQLISLEQMFERLQESQATFKADTEINQLRAEMYHQAIKAAELPPGIFRLTMPTGGGKTRTSLGFGLKHALTHGLRRVIYAIPFTSIIDQTAQEFRKILNLKGEENVLEHHSALEVGKPDQRETELWAKLLSESWDVPLVVTTTVQFFESLFANKTSKLRKLHNIAGSVIVFDEVQSLPTHLLKPILDGLNELVKRYRVSVILCTATQPALSAESGFEFGELQSLRDIVPNADFYFSRFERVEYQLDIQQPTEWSEVARRMTTHETPKILCIVNLRRHAQELYELVQKEDRQAIHLSTYMFPAHRKQLLGIIRRRVKSRQPCRVVSTTLIECGVNVDFPRVFRALGPLDSIVQAAGRCNREGELIDELGNPVKGQVWVFKPADAVVPKGDYFVKVKKAETILKGNPNLNSPQVFTTYFQDVYQRSETDVKGIQKLREDLDFETTAKNFRLIDSDTFPVVITAITARSHLFRLKVPKRLLGELENAERIRPDLWPELQQYTVSIFRSKLPELLRYMRRIFLKSGGELELYEWTGVYDYRLGIRWEDDYETFVV